MRTSYTRKVLKYGFRNKAFNYSAVGQLGPPKKGLGGGGGKEELQLPQTFPRDPPMHIAQCNAMNVMQGMQCNAILVSKTFSDMSNTSLLK